MTLVEFLEARVIEDEIIANAASDGAAHWHALYAYRDIKDGQGHYVVLADGRYPTVEQAAHIARHDPARILRQCEAVRLGIAELLRLDAIGDVAGRSAAENALRHLASVHRDHADFDPNWA
jgi:L-fucose mutarotase/ribose pyranase (RbsD/FucU family)